METFTDPELDFEDTAHDIDNFKIFLETFHFNVEVKKDLALDVCSNIK